MKKIVLMLAVAAFSTGAIAQTNKTVAATQTQSAPSKPAAAAKPAVVAKPSETQKGHMMAKVDNHNKKHKHAVKPAKTAETK